MKRLINKYFEIKNKIDHEKQNDYSILYIYKPSENLQLELVKEDAYLIQYIKNPAKRVIEYIYKNNRDIFDRFFELKE